MSDNVTHLAHGLHVEHLDDPPGSVRLFSTNENLSDEVTMTGEEWASVIAIAGPDQRDPAIYRSALEMVRR